MIIDVHAHVYRSPRLRPYPGAATPFMSAAQQIEVMNRLGVDKAVILPLNCAECPAEPQSVGEVLELCAEYPGRFIPFCNIDPRLPKRPECIEREDFDFLLGQYRDLGCRGIGELTARIPWTCNPMKRMLESAAGLGMPVTFHTITPNGNSYGVIDKPGLPGLESVLREIPNLKLLGHSQAFWSEMSGDLTLSDKNGYPSGPIKPGGAVPRLMRAYPGLHGDISAGSGYNALTRDPEFGLDFLEEFQDRILMGLDFCSPVNDMRHIHLMKQIYEEGKISKNIFEKVMWKNANRVLGLGLPDVESTPAGDSNC